MTIDVMIEQEVRALDLQEAVAQPYLMWLAPSIETG